MRSIVARALADIAVGIELASLPSSSSEWRARAYAGAAEAVRSGAASLEDPAATPGIGASIAGTIRRIVEAAAEAATSERQRARAQAEARRAVTEHADARLLEAYRAFRSVLGIGDKKARELVLRGGLRSLRDLRAREARVAHGVDTPLVRLGLRFHEELERRVPLGDALHLVRRLRRALPGAERRLLPPAASQQQQQQLRLHLLPLGSVRRQKDTVGDVDLLLWSDSSGRTDKDEEEEGRRVMAAMRDAAIDVLGVDYVATLKCGTRRLSFVARIPPIIQGGKGGGGSEQQRKQQQTQVCRVDVFGARDVTEHATFALYGTGDAEFNEAMRLHAKRRGYRLNEYGLFALGSGRSGRSVPLRSERDIFEALGMRYVPPRRRTGEGAVANSLVPPRRTKTTN